MKYYSTSELNQLFNHSFSFEKLDELLLTTSDTDLISFLNHLKTPNASVLFGWMEQWKEIVEILKRGNTSVSFSDYLKLREHVLYESFKQFVSPFLFPRLYQNAQQGLLNTTLEYTVLLENDSRAIVENEISGQIERLFLPIHELHKRKKISEEELVGKAQKVINDQITKILNGFSKRSYSHVVSYVEHCFSILKSKGCTLRLGNWIIVQLQQLHLNPEHVEQLSEYQAELKSGVIQMYNKGKKKNARRISPYVSAIGLGALAIFVGWIILFKPWSEQPTPQELEQASSFTTFSVEERKHIDSLLKVLQPEILPQFSDENIDNVEGRELMVDAREAFANKTVDAFYQVWEDYLTKDSTSSQGTCQNLSKQVKHQSLPDGFTKLEDKKNGKPTFFRNESEYSVQIVVFNDKPNADAYYKELKTGEEVEFNLSVGEQIVVVAGKTPVFHQGTIKSIVFCEFDYTTISTLMTCYILKKGTSYNYKFLIAGTNISDFQVIDMYGVLEVSQ